MRLNDSLSNGYRLGFRLWRARACLGLSFICVGGLQADEQSPEDLVSILRSQLEPVQTIQAVVTETEANGVSRAEFYQARLQYLDLVEVQHPEYYRPEDRSRSVHNGGLPLNLSSPRRFRYVWSRPGLLRAEYLDDEFANHGHVRFFNGEVWKSYESPKSDNESPRVGIGVESDALFMLEFAQGTSIISPITGPLRPGVDVGFTVPPAAIVRKSIHWPDLLDVVDMQTAIAEVTPRPCTGEMLPSLRVRSPQGTLTPAAGVSVEAAVFEITIWFDPEQDHRISAVQYSRFQPNGDFTDGELAVDEVLYPPAYQLTWSNPIEVNGEIHYQNCRIGLFDTVTNYETDTNWQHLLTAETRVFEYEFSSWTASGETCDPSKFEPPMEPGTFVVDNIEGVAYELDESGQPINKIMLPR